jgi:hypothetical protein
VAVDRLDIYTQFLLPKGIAPRRHKTIETTDIMMQMVASGRASRPCRAGWLWNMPKRWPSYP